MDTSRAHPHARTLLAVPVVTDNDVLARVAALVEPRQRRRPALWLFFIKPDGSQVNLVVPIGDIPEVPELTVVSNLCRVIAEVIASSVPGGRAVVTLARPGSGQPRKPDLDWLHALQRCAATHRAPIRMFCLATPDGVRQLGPVTAG